MTAGKIDLKKHILLGQTDLSVSRMGLGSGYKVPAKAVEKAFHEYGVNYFCWEMRKPGMKEGLQNLIKTRRDDLVITLQSYDHPGFWLKGSIDKALTKLGTDRVEVLFLSGFNSMPWERVIKIAADLKAAGKVRYLGISGHNRPLHGQLARASDSPFDLQMVRYNAAHRGAESDIFEGLPAKRPGITTYTATKWGKLLSPKKMPPGEKPLTPAECYRFALSHPMVDLCLCAPRNEEEMDEDLLALSQGPLSSEEMERICRIGDYVHG